MCGKTVLNCLKFHVKNERDLQINNRLTQNCCYKSRKKSTMMQLPSEIILGLNEVVKT